MFVRAVGSVGNGYFTPPGPGDYICMTVTYDPLKNVIMAYVVDLNTGATASLTYNLGGVFTPPPSGTYVFGVAGGSTGGAPHANWGVIYIDYQG